MTLPDTVGREEEAPPKEGRRVAETDCARV